MEPVLIKKQPTAKTETKQEFKIIKVKPYKLKELAEIYDMNRKTFRGWVNKFKNEIGERNGHYYSIAQVEIIFGKLKLPSYVKLSIDDADAYDDKHE